MKKLFAAIILSLTGLAAMAQSVNEKIAGRNLLTGADIMAKERVFAERIDTYYIDTTTNCVTLQLRSTRANGMTLNNTGRVVLYDMTNETVKWDQKINYQSSTINQSNSTIILSRSKSSCMDTHTGQQKWMTNSYLHRIDADHNIGFGYSSPTSNMLQGVSLINGGTLWRRKIKRDYGWNDFKFLNDSTALITAAGLHSVNLKDGTGWDYDAATGRKDYSSVISANVVGVALLFLTGSGAITTGHDLVSDLASNTLIADSCIYFADADRLSCFNYDGSNKWWSKFDKNTLSKSVILTKGDTLYMINLGYALMWNSPIDYGTPFVAAFNKQSGERIFMTKMWGNQSYVQDWIKKDSTILILFNNRIVKYSLTDGSLISERLLTPDNFGQPKSFLEASGFVRNQSRYESPVLSNPDNTYLVTEHKVIILNGNFKPIGEIEFNQLYQCGLKTDKYRFLANEMNAIVVDNNDNEVATFDANSSATLKDGKLYQVTKNALMEIDLREFL